MRARILMQGCPSSENMRRLELYNAISCNSSAIRWAHERGLLATEQMCPECGAQMKEVLCESSDGIIYKCARTQSGKRHYKKLSIRTGSIFADSHLTIKSYIFTVYEWAVQTPRDEAAYQVGTNKKTTSQLYKNFRELASWMVECKLAKQIGDEHSIVELDECQIGRRKSHRGRIPSECWVLGGLVRGSNPQRCFLEIVAKRDEQTLTEVIMRRVHPRAFIITDGWKSYTNLSNIGFRHKSVNHSKNFLCPEDPTIHTQGVENMWRCLRRFLNSKGSYSRRHLQSYIDEFIFRKHFTNPFESIVSAIAERHRFE